MSETPGQIVHEIVSVTHTERACLYPTVPCRKRSAWGGSRDHSLPDPLAMSQASRHRLLSPWPGGSARSHRRLPHTQHGLFFFPFARPLHYYVFLCIRAAPAARCAAGLLPPSDPAPWRGGEEMCCESDPKITKGCQMYLG